MVSFPEDGYYRIIAYGTGSFPSGTQILLEDPLAGRILDLAKTPEYIFEGQKIDKPLCFYLLFYGAAFGTDPDYQKGIRIYASGNRIFIHSQVPEKDSRVLIYNLLGQLLAMEDLQEQPVNSFEIAGCTGVCFVKVISSRGTAMKKVMLE
jgi:hypothetical protein